MTNPYPDLPIPRAKAIATDLLVLLLLWACWQIGTSVHDAVSELDVLGRGVQQAGTQVQDGFAEAGDRVDGTPIVGNRLEDALDDAGKKTGVPVVRAGTRGREAVADLASILGWTAGGVPALLVLYVSVPRRVRSVRGVLAARKVFASSHEPERQRLLAMRAAFGLPLTSLLAHTKDPIGDLQRDDYRPLLKALGAEHGLRLPAPALAG